VLIEDQSQTYQVFGMNCLKLEEFKQGDPGDLLFSSKALKGSSNLSEENILALF